MLEIRLKISKCFDKIENRHLEAQLAALACLYLVNRKYPDKYDSEKKKIAQENLDNLKARNNSKTKTKKNNKALSVCVNEQDIIEMNGIKVFKEFLNVDKQLIRFHANKSKHFFQICFYFYYYFTFYYLLLTFNFDLNNFIFRLL